MLSIFGKNVTDKVGTYLVLLDYLGKQETRKLRHFTYMLNALYQKHTKHILKYHIITAKPPSLSKRSTVCTRHFVVSPMGSNLRKLNTGAQLQPSLIQRGQNRFCTSTPSWRNGAHKLEN